MHYQNKTETMKTISKYIFILATLSILAFSTSCQKDQEAEDREIIENYISEHKLNAVEYQNSGLFYVIEKEGGSQHPTKYSQITINYKGYLTNGSVFDSNDNIMFSLDRLIVGWQLGIPLIGESGTIKLLIPSGMAYGKISKPNIPANSVLIFDIDLLLFNSI